MREITIDYWISLWDEASGGFRFAPHQPATLMATAYSVLGLEFVRGLSRLSSIQEQAIISFLMSGSCSNGTFCDPRIQQEDIIGAMDFAYVIEETTTFCQQALDALLAPVPPQRDWPKNWRTASDLIRYFESFPWKNPWLDSNRVMFILSQFCHDAERHQKPELFELVDACLDWLDTHQSPETGLWQGAHSVSLNNAMAATFHFTFFYFYRRRPLNYPEKIIDSCLALQEANGLFSKGGIGHTCLDYDAIDLLAKVSLITDYRSRAVQQTMGSAAQALIGLQNSDGGFANSKFRVGERFYSRKRRILRKLKLGRFVPPPPSVPVTEDYHPGIRLLSAPSRESNAFSSWFRLLAHTLAKFKYRLDEPEDMVVFRRLPFLGYHDPLAIQTAYGINQTELLIKNKTSIQKRKKIKLAHRPLVSVIIPAYNAARFLPKTLASLRAQTYQNWEGIIVNDGSTDETHDMSKHWIRSDTRFRLVDQKNKGLGGARNSALAVAKGELVHCLDADDLIEPDFYQTMISELCRSNDSMAVGRCAVSSVKYFWGNGRITRTYIGPPGNKFSFEALAQSNPCQPVRFLFERSILHHTGLFDENLRHCHDWDMWLRFARIKVDFVRVESAFAWYRVLSVSLSSSYVTYIKAIAEVIRRTAMPDKRINKQELAPLCDLDIVKHGIVRYWRFVLMRAINKGDAQSTAKLFAWGRENLPKDFWLEPETYNIHPRFEWAYDNPSPINGKAVALMALGDFFLQAMKLYWPELGRARRKYIISNLLSDFLKVMKKENDGCSFPLRIRLITHAFVWSLALDRQALLLSPKIALMVIPPGDMRSSIFYCLKKFQWFILRMEQ